MSLMSFVGRERNLLAETPEHCRQLKLSHPILTNDDLEQLRESGLKDFPVRTVPILFPVAEGPGALERALSEACREAERQIDEGAAMLILSDRGVGARAGGHPQPAGHRGRPPPPGAQRQAPPERAGDRDRRGPRGAPLRLPDRLRGQRGQPLPGLRDHPGPAGPRAPRPPSCPPRRPRKTTSRPSRRGWPRSCPRWASPRCAATAARNASRPWASGRS